MRDGSRDAAAALSRQGRYQGVALTYYPAVGDWDANGTHTVGVKQGMSWLCRNTNSDGAADLTFDFGLANDLPIVWGGSGATGP